VSNEGNKEGHKMAREEGVQIVPGIPPRPLPPSMHFRVLLHEPLKNYRTEVTRPDESQPAVPAPSTKTDPRYPCAYQVLVRVTP
jgi:hypothetical protein